jgi:hypothetical protein
MLHMHYSRAVAHLASGQLPHMHNFHRLLICRCMAHQPAGPGVISLTRWRTRQAGAAC